MNVVVYKDGFEKNAILNNFRRQGIESLHLNNIDQIGMHNSQKTLETLIVDYDTIDNNFEIKLNELKRFNPYLKVVAIINYADEKIIRKLTQLCINSIIVKPFSMRELLPYLKEEEKEGENNV